MTASASAPVEEFTTEMKVVFTEENIEVRDRDHILMENIPTGSIILSDIEKYGSSSNRRRLFLCYNIGRSGYLIDLLKPSISFDGISSDTRIRFYGGPINHIVSYSVPTQLYDGARSGINSSYHTIAIGRENEEAMEPTSLSPGSLKLCSALLVSTAEGVFTPFIRFTPHLYNLSRASRSINNCDKIKIVHRIPKIEFKLLGYHSFN